MDLPPLNLTRPGRNTVCICLICIEVLKFKTKERKKNRYFHYIALINVTSQEQKKSLPAPPPKTKTNQKGHSSALPDVLTCMLKDTTSEHKTHLFDLKCKICTGKSNVSYNSQDKRDTLLSDDPLL